MINYDNFEEVIGRAVEAIVNDRVDHSADFMFVAEGKMNEKPLTGLSISPAHQIIQESVVYKGQIVLVKRGLHFQRTETGMRLEEDVALINSAKKAFNEHCALKFSKAESLPALRMIPDNLRLRALAMSKKD